MVVENCGGTWSRCAATKRVCRDASQSLVPTIATTAITNRTVKYRVGIRVIRGIYARIICFFPPAGGLCSYELFQRRSRASCARNAHRLITTKVAFMTDTLDAAGQTPLVRSDMNLIWL